MVAYITVGAKTTHGGEVITGSPYTTHNGVQVSRKGDKVICKKCKKLTTILTGDPSFIVDGAPIAREGDVTSCGAKLIAIQQSFAESDFEVFGVEQPEPMFEQPAPLVFPKSDPDALFASLRRPDTDSSKDHKSEEELDTWIEETNERLNESENLIAGPGMYGADEIPGSPAAMRRERERQQRFLEEDNQYERYVIEGNHKYKLISPPICSTSDPKCNVPAVVKVLNDKGAYPNQKNPNIFGGDNVGDVDIVGPWGKDPVKSSAIYNSQGLQVGIRNETLEGHALHPGVVERRVISQDGNLHVLTEGGGFGYGGGPNANETILNLVWGPVDQVIADDFKKN